jgi:2-polyprenyl-6-methoxyphenol hydroxylase-like FAD-dependent oxidoreductase
MRPTGRAASTSSSRSLDERARAGRAARTVGDPDRDPDDPRTLSTSVNRCTLREILGAGLDDRIHYGRELAGHEPDAHGVTLRFVDGSSERADVLVGADGVHSAVRRTLLPGAATVDTGPRIIYGRTPLRACRVPPTTAAGGRRDRPGGAAERGR